MIFLFTMPFSPKEPYNSINDTLKKIKNGDQLARGKLIFDYRPFIIKVVSEVAGKFIEIENDEEYSIGLMAFNESIDSFISGNYKNFFSFSSLVIKRRVINYLKSTQKNNNVYPFSFYENKDENAFEEHYLASQQNNHFENIESRIEIENFERKLTEYSLSFDDIIDEMPKHKDSTMLSIKIARTIATQDELYERMEKRKNVPMVDLLKQIKVSKRTVERNRKFIIAVALILRSNLNIFKFYLKDLEEGRR